MTQRSEIKKMFGTFWNSAWKGDEFYDALVTTMEFMFNRLGKRVEDLPLFTSRFDIPTQAGKEADYLLVDELTLTRKLRTLGSFNMDTGVELDELQFNPSIWAMPTPVEDISIITDSPVKPQVMWHKGQEFDIVDGELLLYRDPFQTAFRQHIKSEGDDVIKLADIWLLDTREDKNYLADHFGRVIDMLTPSNEYYKRILNAVYDLLQEGATVSRLAAFIGSIADTDVARVNGSVEEVWDEGDRTWVEVAGVLHSCPGTGRAIVAPGAEVAIGDRLFDVFDIVSGRESIDPGSFPQLFLGPAYIETVSGQGLTFENADLQVTSYKFPIGGYSGDVDAFWANAEAEAASRGIDLHDAIIAGQQPPWTINPFEFIRENFLSSATIFITVDFTAIKDPEALKLFRYLDPAVPAGTTYFMNLFGNADEDTVPLASDEDEPGFLANDADELENILLTDYVIGSEKLY